MAETEQVVNSPNKGLEPFDQQIEIVPDQDKHSEGDEEGLNAAPETESQDQEPSDQHSEGESVQEIQKTPQKKTKRGRPPKNKKSPNEEESSSSGESVEETPPKKRKKLKFKVNKEKPI